MIERIVLGGGCFWCIEAVFSNVKGVIFAKSGYSGGARANPTYESVCTGVSGHAEVVDIKYDSSVISLEKIIEIFFVVHNPTTLNQQGADRGTQYRSVIYFENKSQKEIILSSIKKAQNNFNDKIVTEVSPLGDVFEAEAYHQNYYALNSSQPYCKIVIEPKLQKYVRNFKDQLL